MTSEEETAALKAALRKGMELANGLVCLGCRAQGRGLAAPGKCCRDVDCDAGWYGIGCDEVKAFLDEAGQLMPEALAEIEAGHDPSLAQA